MAQSRVVKVSVFKDQKLVDEATFDKDEVLVGSFARSDLRLDDAAIERRHVMMRVTPSGELEIENLAGAGRVQLNGADVEKTAALKTGDELLLPPFRLLVSVREQGAVDGLSGFYAAERTAKQDEGGRHVLEIAQFWGNTLLSVKHFSTTDRVTLGERKGDTYFAPEEVLGADQYELIAPRDGHYAVNLSSPKVNGDVLVKEKIYTVAELKAAGLLTNGWLVLDAHTRCRLAIGMYSLLMSHAVLPPKPKAPVLGRMHLGEHIYTSLSFIAHVLLMIILSLIPEEQLVAQRDASRSGNRAFDVLKMAMVERKQELEEKKKEEEEKKKEEEELEKARKEAEGQAAKEVQQEQKQEEQKQEEAKDTSRRPTDELQTKLAPDKLREYNKQVALATGVTKVFDQQTDLVQQFTGGAGMWGGRSRGLKVIMSAGGEGDLAPGEYWAGSGGLDPFGGAGGGPGGGGFMGTALASTLGGPAGDGTTDIAGLGKEDGKEGGRIDLKDRAQKVVVTSAEVDITGGLDKDTIQRYIRSKMGQIRWCYKNELQKDRDLKGKITVEFVIAPTGKVLSAKIAGSTMGNQAVEACITQKVAMWRFPASKQGAAAKVRYPFIFKAL